MSPHIFVVPRGGMQGRWREAFNDLKLVSDAAEAIRVARPGALVWIDVLQGAALAAIRAARPDVSLVAMSLNPGEVEGMRAFEAGARGYCHTLAVPEMLRQVAVVVSNGGLWVGADLMNRAAGAVARASSPVGAGMPAVLRDLTPRERDVALQVGAGASNKEVAQRLDITPRTVKAHMGAIFEKLGVRDRLQLVLMLRQSTVPVVSEAD